MTGRSCTGYVPGTITAGVSAGQGTGVVYMSRLEMKRAWGNADLRDSGDTTSDLAEHSRPWLTGVGVGRARVVPDLYPTKITEGQTMPTNTIHAKISDLPGWPCPPRVRDIPTTADSWGWIMVSDLFARQTAVASDELGYLWVGADVAPRYRLPMLSDANPGAIVFWTPNGVGLYVHPRSYPHLPCTSRLDHQPDQWLPVAEVSKELPAWIADGGGVR